VTSGLRRRWQAVHFGRRGEMAAAALMFAKGYRILARDIKTPMGEIDLLARRRGVLAVVEVKARPTPDEAAAALGIGQRRRIARAAAWLVSQRRDFAGLAVRYDVIMISPWSLPRHVEGAWRDGMWAG
jgi:putative endonuclease